MTIDIKSSAINTFLEVHSNTDDNSLQQLPAKATFFLSPGKGSQGIVYAVKSQLDEDVSEYAYKRLSEIAEGLKCESLKPNRWILLKMGECIARDFELINSQRGLFSRVWNALLVGLGIRHSQREIEDRMALVLRRGTVPQFGGCIPEGDAAVRVVKHRNVLTSNEGLAKGYGKDSLTNAANAIYEESLKKAILPTTDPQRLIAKAKLKEAAVLEVYKQKIDDRVAKGYYDPGIIPHEIDKDLGPITGIPVIADAGQLEHELFAEADKYKGHLSRHQLHYIKEDIAETLKLYCKAFPKRSLVDAFALGRDMIRIAVYQELYDKGSFTGSDHGSKHIHNNIVGAEGLQLGMKNGNIKDMFMVRFIHFLHDIGYTTGLSAIDFACSKDHPFIGAKMIDENREYFKYYLNDGDEQEAEEAVDVLRNGVLYHAIMMANLTQDSLSEMRGGMHPNLIRAETSISDACALTYDRKTQEFWEQPTTLIAISRLRLFLVQFPQYIDKFNVPLEDDQFFVKGILDKNNPIDVLAHEVFTKTRRELIDATDRFDIPKDKRTLFKDAIRVQFNAFTTSTTFGQYGGVLTGVTAQPNSDRSSGAPEFLPQFELAPSIIYGLVRDLYGEDLAQQSFKKLLAEFGADPAAISKQLNFIAEERVKGKLFPVSERDFRTPGAVFSLHDHFDVDPADEHLTQMQKNLALVVGKMQSVYKSQTTIIDIRDRIAVFKGLEELRTGSGGFLEFLTDKVLPVLNVKEPQSKRVVDGIKLLSAKVATSDPFDKIREADKKWNAILDSLKTPHNDNLNSILDRYGRELAKLRGKRPSAEILKKLNEELLHALPADLDKNGEYERTLKSIVEVFNQAERDYFQVEAVLKMALTSNEEYAYMCGGTPRKRRESQITDILVAK